MKYQAPDEPFHLHLQVAELPWLYKVFVVLPSVNCSDPEGSIVKPKSSAPTFSILYSHLFLVALHAGRLSVIPDDRVPISKKLWVWSAVVVAVMAVQFVAVTPFASNAAALALELALTPALPVSNELNVLAPAIVWLPVETTPRFEASALGMFNSRLVPFLVQPIIAALVVIEGFRYTAAEPLEPSKVPSPPTAVKPVPPLATGQVPLMCDGVILP